MGSERPGKIDFEVLKAFAGKWTVPGDATLPFLRGEVRAKAGKDAEKVIFGQTCSNNLVLLRSPTTPDWSSQLEILCLIEKNSTQIKKLASTKIQLQYTEKGFLFNSEKRRKIEVGKGDAQKLEKILI